MNNKVIGVLIEIWMGESKSFFIYDEYGEIYIECFKVEFLKIL